MTLQDVARQAAEAEWNRWIAERGATARDLSARLADAVALALLQQLYADIPGDDLKEQP